MHKLSPTTKSVRVRRLHLVVTDELVAKHTNGIIVQNELHNYAVKYLERTYGVRHINRHYPNTRTSKVYVIKDLMAMFAKERYSLKRWNATKIGLHSQGAQQLLLTLFTNFGEYRKALYHASKMTAQEKLDYVNNAHGNNPQHRSWYRKGSLAYMHDGQSYRTITLPANGIVEVTSAHHIKIQHFGVVQVVENIKNYKGMKIVMTKIKHKADGHFELQLVISSDVVRVEPTTKVAADWNMTNNKMFHTSNDEEIYLSNKVVSKADNLERQINRLKSERDRYVWLGHSSRRISKMNNEIRRLNTKRVNILDEHYKQIAHLLIDDYDVIVIENLNVKDMRAKKRQAHSANRKLAMIKPYRMAQFIEMLANRTGKTLIKVDAYKTSQVEYGTSHREKHDTSVRQWVSTLTGEVINRDLNASLNILDWGLNPEHHIKLKDYPHLSASSLVTIN